MIDFIRTLLAPPRFDDDEKELMAGFLHITILTVFVMEILIGVTDAVTGIPTTGIMLAMTIVPLGLAFWLNRRGKFTRLAAYIVSITMVFIQTGILSHGQGIHDIGLIVYAVDLNDLQLFSATKRRAHRNRGDHCGRGNIGLG